MKFSKYLAGVVTVIAITVFGLTLVHALGFGGVVEQEAEVQAIETTSVAQDSSDNDFDSNSQTSQSANVSEAKKPVVVPEIPADTPSRLRIPSLNMDVHIQKVGISTEGNMMTPTNSYDVGWYKYGTIPGREGSAVIAGHLDSILGLNAVFGDLKSIQKGADIYVDMKDGSRAHFIVTSVETFDYKDPSKNTEIFARGGESQLRLITCQGDWVQDDHTYDERLLVTAVKE